MSVFGPWPLLVPLSPSLSICLAPLQSPAALRAGVHHALVISPLKQILYISTHMLVGWFRSAAHGHTSDRPVDPLRSRGKSLATASLIEVCLDHVVLINEYHHRCHFARCDNMSRPRLETNQGRVA
jgi:hypothetical protein